MFYIVTGLFLKLWIAIATRNKHRIDIRENCQQKADGDYGTNISLAPTNTKKQQPNYRKSSAEIKLRELH